MAGTCQGNCLCGVRGAGMFIAGCAFLITAAFPVVQIALGAVYIHECPEGPMIPIYLIVFGTLALLTIAMFTLLKLLSPAAQSHIWIICIIILLVLFFTWLLFGSYHVYSIYPPNYDKNLTTSDSFTRGTYTVPAPDSQTSENQSLQRLNRSQVFWRMVQAGALNNMNSRTNRDLKNINHQPHQVVAVLLYCNRTVYLFAFWTTTLVHVFVGNALLLIICLCGFMKCTDVFVRHLMT